MRLPRSKDIDTPRLAAWVAITQSQKGLAYVQKTLADWKGSSEAHALARELASGTVRRRASLDYWLRYASTHGLSKLGQPERALLRMMIYQLAFCTGIPAYAAIHETVAIARRFGHPRFAAFCNAIGRKLADNRPSLPDDPAIYYSYPPWFVSELCQQFGHKQACLILEAGNHPPPLMARVRPGLTLRPLETPQVAANLYIQNRTPVELLARALEDIQPPKRILDLCAAPGGKAILAHDLFPSAELHVNDVAPQKRALLEENFTRCGIPATIHIGPGQSFASTTPFDLILLDVPCSNSGVLAKRVEARWRLTPDRLTALQSLQKELIAQALTLLSPGGTLCYLTCSILSQENTEAAKWEQEFLQLPDPEGHDGGFAATLRMC